VKEAPAGGQSTDVFPADEGGAERFEDRTEQLRGLMDWAAEVVEESIWPSTESSSGSEVTHAAELPSPEVHVGMASWPRGLFTGSALASCVQRWHAGPCLGPQLWIRGIVQACAGSKLRHPEATVPTLLLQRVHDCKPP
jgi:hypothetical protein